MKKHTILAEEIIKLLIVETNLDTLTIATPFYNEEQGLKIILIRFIKFIIIPQKLILNFIHR